MNNFIEMEYEEFVATYKPILNHIDTNASFDGYMFETYGDEVEFVKSQSPDKIWMYGDGDSGNSYIWSGWGFVNRLGYFITEVPCPPNTDIQIKVGVNWYYCEGCGTEMEDEDSLINEKYYDYDCCPLCATVEQLAEIEETTMDKEIAITPEGIVEVEDLEAVEFHSFGVSTFKI